MPLLYGEGEKAFMRLQEEICRTKDDHSIFPWTAKSSWFDEHATYRGLFARSPAEFGVDYLSFSHVTNDGFVPPSSSTSLGFNVQLSLIPLTRAKEMVLRTNPPVDSPNPSNEFMAILRTRTRIQLGIGPTDNKPEIVAILLKELLPGGTDRQYARVNPAILYRLVLDDQKPLQIPWQ